MSRIVAVGNEDFTLGFELVGIEAFGLEKLENILFGKEDIGVVIISVKDYDNLNLRTKTQIEKLLKPIVVILSGEDIKGNSLREKVIKALGVDLLK